MKKPLVSNTDRASGLWAEHDAVTYLQTTPRALRDWRDKRGLPHLKLTAKTIRYRQADLDAWLEKSRVITGTSPIGRITHPLTQV
jgi:hypothetical protein